MCEGIRVEFTEHAEKRLVARKLERSQVIEVASNPEQVVYTEGGLPIAQSRILYMGMSALLRVVFHDEGDTRLVITAYPTTQVGRYWQKEDQDED
jgi:hypothetical protein